MSVSERARARVARSDWLMVSVPARNPRWVNLFAVLHKSRKTFKIKCRVVFSEFFRVIIANRKSQTCPVDTATDTQVCSLVNWFQTFSAYRR